jgi:hypothetical protein
MPLSFRALRTSPKLASVLYRTCLRRQGLNSALITLDVVGRGSRARLAALGFCLYSSGSGASGNTAGPPPCIFRARTVQRLWIRWLPAAETALNVQNFSSRCLQQRRTCDVKSNSLRPRRSLRCWGVAIAMLAKGLQNQQADAHRCSRVWG